VNYLVVTNEPLKLLLKHTVSVGTAELVNDSIQARFGGAGLPTAIVDSNEVITNLSNLVTVKVNNRDTIFSGDSSVSERPVLACLDSSIHEGLNLTHGVVCDVYVRDWRDCRSGDLSSVSSTLQFAEQLVKHEVGAVVVFHEGAVSSTLKCFGEDCDLLSGESDGDHGPLR